MHLLHLRFMPIWANAGSKHAIRGPPWLPAPPALTLHHSRPFAHRCAAFHKSEMPAPGKMTEVKMTLNLKITHRTPAPGKPRLDALCVRIALVQVIRHTSGCTPTQVQAAFATVQFQSAFQLVAHTSMLASRQHTSCLSPHVASSATGSVAAMVCHRPGGQVPTKCLAPCQQRCPPSKHSTVCRARDLETAEETLTRRLRESAVVEGKTYWVEDAIELRQSLIAAGDKLVVLEIQGDGVCETGIAEEAEMHWKLDEAAEHQRRLEACRRIKHGVQRVARECSDVVFLECMIPDGPDGDAMKADLGVHVLPTIQFFRNSKLLWQQQGYVGMEEEMREGVLYYGDAAAGGVKGTDYVQELSSMQDVNRLVQGQEPGILTVINVSTTLCKPCIKVFPAVLALAKSFRGHAAFGKLVGDASHEAEAAMQELGILEVPTFVFYRDGRELGRHVGSSRGDLIGRILQYQAEAGIAPPPPPPRVKTVPARTTRAKKASRW